MLRAKDESILIFPLHTILSILIHYNHIGLVSSNWTLHFKTATPPSDGHMGLHYGNDASPEESNQSVGLFDSIKHSLKVVNGLWLE